MNLNLKQNTTKQNYQSLTHLNSYRIECYAENYSCPKNIFELESVLKAKEGKIIKIIGAGNNIIFKREFYNSDYLIISTRRLSRNVLKVSSNRLIVGAGVTLKRLCAFAAKNSLSGMEKLWGIPSSVGGAITMNAGAFGCDIHSLLKTVTVYDLLHHNVKTLFANEIGSAYRKSIFQNGRYIIISSEFELVEGDRDNIIQSMQCINEYRKDKFPISFPSAGSVFKRPINGDPASKMIDELNLKGYKVGGAMISNKHAGFIVNTGLAKSRDILKLIEYIKNTVLNEYGIQLEVEQVSI